jgi:hypothetical protein
LSLLEASVNWKRVAVITLVAIAVAVAAVRLGYVILHYIGTCCPDEVCRC